MNPTQRNKAGWAELTSFRADPDRSALMDKASRQYMGPVWGYDNTFDSAFDLGFMAGWNMLLYLQTAGETAGGQQAFDLLCSKARNLLERMVHDSDSQAFEQWMFGREYQKVFQGHVTDEIKTLADQGKTAEQIANALYELHS